MMFNVDYTIFVMVQLPLCLFWVTLYLLGLEPFVIVLGNG